MSYQLIDPIVFTMNGIPPGFPNDYCYQKLFQIAFNQMNEKRLLKFLDAMKPI